MSDNESESEQQQQMEKIFICADVWYGVFSFLCSFDVGLKMALISDRLDALVDVHFKSRKWLSLGRLHIYRAIGGNGAQIVSKRSGGRFSERLPIPHEAILKKVIGFELISISYIDQTVLEFLQRLCRLDSSGTYVDFCNDTTQSRSWEIIRQNIWPLVSDNICGLSLDSSDLVRLRQSSPAILRNCANLRTIVYLGFSPEFPADDNVGASSSKAVAKWLITPRGDGLPKVLRCGSLSAKMEGLKWSFRHASQPVNFIIAFRYDDHSVPFELTNNLTRERLTLRRRFKEVFKDYWLLVRCPIGREEDEWTNWEEEAIEWEWKRQWNRISICFNARDIVGQESQMIWDKSWERAANEWRGKSRSK